MHEFKNNRIRGANNTVFSIASNEAFSFEIGKEGQTKYYLSGEMAGDPQEPVFNGTLFLPGGDPGGIVIDNFPKAEAPGGWERRPSLDREGYDLVHTPSGEVIFGYRVHEKVCKVTTNIYDETGEPVAECDGDTLTIHKGPYAMPPWVKVD